MSCHILPSRVLRLLCSATALRLPSDGLDSFQARSSDTVLTVSELGLSDAAVMISLGFGVWVGRVQGSGAISRHAMPRARARCGIAAAVPCDHRLGPCPPAIPFHPPCSRRRSVQPTCPTHTFCSGIFSFSFSSVCFIFLETSSSAHGLLYTNVVI